MPCVQANICAHMGGVENLGVNSLNLEYENMEILSSHSKRHRESSK